MCFHSLFISAQCGVFLHSPSFAVHLDAWRSSKSRCCLCLIFGSVALLFRESVGRNVGELFDRTGCRGCCGGSCFGGGSGGAGGALEVVLGIDMSDDMRLFPPFGDCDEGFGPEKAPGCVPDGAVRFLCFHTVSLTGPQA